MDELRAAAVARDLSRCKALLCRQLAPALVSAVTSLSAEHKGVINVTNTLACIKYFLQCGARVDARRDGRGKTALMVAAQAGRLDAVKVMLQHWKNAGADAAGSGSGSGASDCGDDCDDGENGGPGAINAVGGDRRGTALIWAALNGHAEVVAALVNLTGKGGHAVDLNVANTFGVTALIFATSKNHVEIVSTLLNAPGKDGFAVDLNVKSENGNTALILAARFGYVQITTALLAATDEDGVPVVDLNLVNKEGCTALMLAAHNNHVEIVTQLLGATGNDGVTRRLLHTADLNVAENVQRNTALIYASGYGHTKIVTALLGAAGENGVAIDLNMTNMYGFTALICAAQKGHADVVTALLDATERNEHITTAVDVALKDKQGHSAHFYATTMHASKFAPELLARLLPPPPPCPKDRAAAFLQSLGVSDVYLNPEFDRCYCRRCYEGQ